MTIPTSLNFSGGPGALPQEVLEEASEAILQAPGTNQSILGISHRSDYFKAILKESEEIFRSLLNIPPATRCSNFRGGAPCNFP
jgi:phosphoserine aminotransferase